MAALTELRESDTLEPMRVKLLKHAERDVLDTRSRGNETRWEIERELAASGPTETLVLDFDGVRAATAPFVDECIGRLLAGMSGGYHEEHPVVAINANPDVLETLDITLSRGRYGLLHLSDRPQLLGGDDIHNDTLRAAWARRQLSASDLANDLGISAQAANNRLKALVQMGALRRALVIPAGGGKEFMYSVPEDGLTPAGPAKSNGRTQRKPVSAK